MNGRSGVRIANRRLGVSILAAGMVVTACSSGSAASVVVATARTSTIDFTPGGFGNLAAGIDDSVVFERHGRVLSVNVRAGQSVAKGALLATVSTVGSSLEASQLSNLLQGDQKLLQQQKLTVGENNPQTIATLGRIADERRSLAAAEGAPARVLAPVAGTVAQLAVTSGASIDSTDVLMHIVDARTVHVVAPIAAEYRSYLTIGSPATVTLTDAAGVSVAATVSAVSPQLNADQTSMDATFTLDRRPDQPVLGSRAYVRMPLSTQSGVTVNSLAISRTAQSPFVFVVTNGQVSMQHVAVGVSDGRVSQILDGLSTGEDVVVSGVQNLVDGTKVQISSRQSQ